MSSSARSPRSAFAAATAAVLLLGTGGATAAPSSPAGPAAAPAASATPSASATGSDACVTDVDDVVTREPSAQMAEPLPEELATTLDAAARASFGQASAPGAVVGVSSPEGTWTAAYGVADPATGESMQVGVHTRIGSVTKPFTATLILQLAEEGQLALEDPVADYIEGIPNGERITLRQLANMTSGVASYTRSTRFTDRFFADPQQVFTPEELVAVGVSESPLFAPGEQFDYSNTNYILLGLVIEQVTDQPVGEVLEEQIFEPLDLDETTWPGDSTEMPEPSARGFTLQGDTATPEAPADATHWNPSWGDTAGALISDMDDLLVYGRAMGTGHGLLDPEAQRERLTSFRPPESGYGLGFGCIDGWVGHTGTQPGYNTTVYYDTTTDTTVVVQATSDIASGDCPESPVLADDPRTLSCATPATRIFAGLSTALGHTFTPNPER
ncbi:serine hydrolase [Kocuria rosea subsp. polaris]|uniref:Serine hydrolase n=1 Tax=Kocuria rosea subsp. polaris TaxID=136273 RepID=A0A0W8I969_KOCRO|nr:serine hydrolase domain-containing protein [Kocuria polaris]KUG56355.1 serine hydrolase [Kocuria polaris]